MDFTQIVSLIGNIGFPIVCCVAMFNYITKNEERHKEEMNKMSEAINNNTNAMNELITEMKVRDTK